MSEEMRQLLAEAWDEGYSAGYGDARYDEGCRGYRAGPESNPYRAAATGDPT